MAETAPVIPDGGSVWWAPKADAPPRRRYAWLLDQLSIDSDYFAMLSLRLLEISADTSAQTADVVLERIESGVVVIARLRLSAGEELVHAQDYIASWVLASREAVEVESRYGRATHLLELPS